MAEWWNGLTLLTQVFFCCAAFFSFIFLWQFIMSLIGLAGEADFDADVDADIDADAGMDIDDIEAASPEEAGESVLAFRVLSLRAILAFCTLFSWAAALYLEQKQLLATALLYALLWGFAGGLLVAVLVHWIRKLAESGTRKLVTCVGTRGRVYLDIPETGIGEVRVTVSGVISMVKARATGGAAVKAGTAVRVAKMLDQTTVEVQPIETDETGKEGEE